MSRGREASNTKSVIGIFVRDGHGVKITQSTNYAATFLYATWADISLSWYAVDAGDNQLNYDGTTYHYIALG